MSILQDDNYTLGVGFNGGDTFREISAIKWQNYTKSRVSTYIYNCGARSKLSY